MSSNDCNCNKCNDRLKEKESKINAILAGFASNPAYIYAIIKSTDTNSGISLADNLAKSICLLEDQLRKYGL